MQRIDIARKRRRKLTCLRINSEVYRTPAHRVVERDRASNAERSQPCQPVRKIAEVLVAVSTSRLSCKRAGDGCNGGMILAESLLIDLEGL